MVYINQTFHDRFVFPASTTKVKLKDCVWSNFISNSDKGGCFGILNICEATITGCCFVNIFTYTLYEYGKGAFMILADDYTNSLKFTFSNNIMYNISSLNLLNDARYHAFYVIGADTSTLESNTMSLYSNGGSYSFLLQSKKITTISYSNFTHCNCDIGSGINVEFFDQSSIVISYSLLSKLGGLELLRLSCAPKSISDSESESQCAFVLIEYVNFIDNSGFILVSLNNNIAASTDSDFKSNFQICLSCTSAQFFGNENMTYPFYVKVPKLNVFSISKFLNCVSDSQLVVQPEIESMFGYQLAKGWTIKPRPTKYPTVTETQKVTESDDQTYTKSPTDTLIPTQPATVIPTEHIDVLKDGEVFTTSSSTSSVLIQGEASINISSLQDIEFSSYKGSSEPKSINLFGAGITQTENQQTAELTVKDFNSVTVNLFATGADKTETVLSVPIVVNEVSNFEINNGFYNGQNKGESQITIKSIKAPTKNSDLTSHIHSNSNLNVKSISFSKSGSEKRLYQTITSQSDHSSNVDSVSISDEADAELVNFTVTDYISINKKSNLRLKQTKVNYKTVIEFDTNSIGEVGQINIENPITKSFFDIYPFAPREIILRITDNSESNKKLPIVMGITENNCQMMLVSFQPQTNKEGVPYRSYCEDDQLFVSIESTGSKSDKKIISLNRGLIAVIIVGSILAIVGVIMLIYLSRRKSSKVMMDASDAYDVSACNNKNNNNAELFD